MIALVRKFYFSCDGEGCIGGGGSGIGLPAAYGKAVLAGSDDAIAGGVDEAQIAGAECEVRMLRFAGVKMKASKAAQGANGRARDGREGEIDLNDFVTAALAGVAHIDVNIERVACGDAVGG